MIKLNEEQIKTLKEAGITASQHSAMALSQLICERVNIAVVKVDVVSSQDFGSIVGGTDTLGAAVYFQILGDLKGSIFLFFKRKDAIRLTDTLLYKGRGEAIMMSEMGASALKEAGNILAASYLSAISEIASFRILLSVPKFVFDWAGYIIDGVFGELMKEEAKAVSITTEFIESTRKIKGYFVFMPSNESLDKILQKLKN